MKAAILIIGALGGSGLTESSQRQKGGIILCALTVSHKKFKRVIEDWLPRCLGK